MHILQITPRYFPNIGGVDVLVQEISEKLVTKGIDVTVYSVDLNQRLPRQQEINGVLVKRFLGLFDDPLYLPEPGFMASLRREKADIMHVHNIHTLLPSIVASLKHKTQKLVVQPHYHRFGQSSLRHSLLGLYKHVINRLVLSSADAVTANSTYEKKILLEDFVRCKNVVLVPEGVDADEIRRVKHDPVEPKRILYVGSLRAYKNVDKVLEGFARLIERGIDFRLVIVGSGPERVFLVNRTYDLGIDSFVKWKQNLSRKELLCEYAGASALVLLSPLESFSRVVYEALLIGVPVVVSDYGATAHLAKGGFAEGVKSLNSEEIADAILRATDRIYAKVTEGPHTFINWEKYCNKIIDIYNRLVETRDASLKCA